MAHLRWLIFRLCLALPLCLLVPASMLSPILPSALAEQLDGAPNGTAATVAKPPPLGVAAEPAPPAAPNAGTKAVPGLAPKPSMAPEIARPLQRLKTDIANAEKTIERIKTDDARLTAQREHLEGFAARAEKLRAAIAPSLTETRALLQKLGKPPGKDEPAESASVAATRAELTRRLTDLAGAVKTSELIEVRARQLIADVQIKRQKLFAKDLFRRTKSPLSPSLWGEISEDAALALRQLSLAAATWKRSAAPYTFHLLVLIAAAGGIWAYLQMLLEGLVQRRLTTSPDHEPGLSERSKIVSWLLPARLLPYGAAMAVFFGGLALLGLLAPPLGGVLLTLAKALAIILIVQVLARIVLAPERPHWRLVNLSDKTSARLLNVVVLMACVFGLDLVLGALTEALFQPVSIRILHAFSGSIILSGLLFAFALLPFEAGWDLHQSDAPEEVQIEVTRPTADRLSAAATQGIATSPQAAAADAPPDSWSPLQLLSLRVVLLIFATAIAVSSITGYVAFGRFLAHQVVITGTIVGIGVLLHLAIRSFAREVASGRQQPAILNQKLGLGANRQSLVAKILALLLNIVLVLALTPWLLLQWGFSGSDIATWGKQALFGLEIGGYHISIARLLLGVLLFVALLLATRQLQRWLDRTVLNRPNVDSGIAHSIRTAVGYVGIMIAVLAAVSYAGIDITNIALVAGALSVGIGFGLQSIVNNFVSGLILLVGRPIKVGDWIDAGGAEGYVRRISVRATEIETFDRATVIIPNSDLISSRVTNWTHRNTLGRVVVSVGVGYDSDPEQVRDLLLNIAQQNETIMKFPAPSVHFVDLGASSLDFSVRVYIADVNGRMTVASELRMAIVKAFRAADIEIPYPQSDIHLRDLDGVKQVLAQVIAERNRKQQENLS